MSQTIFMIHGMWCGPWCWEHYLPVFQERGYRCLTPTLPYHDAKPGQPPDPRLAAAGLSDYATDLEKQLRQLEEKPIILGHSLGGLLAQMLAARNPARALVLLCPAAPAGILSVTPSVLKSFWSNQARWGFWRKPTFPTFAEAVYGAFHLLTPEERRAAYAMMVPDSGRVATQIGFWFLDPSHSSRVDEEKIDCPILVVSGRLDRIVPASVVRRVARKYRPRATYREYENHAHWVIGEPGWREIADDIFDWLENQAGIAPDPEAKVE